MTSQTALPVPNPTLPLAVKLIGSMLLLIVLAIGFARWQGISDKQADAATVWQRDLVFADGPQGSVIVKDAQSQTEIAQFEGEQGFLRSTLRALVRERKRQNIGPDAPMQLLGRADGRLTLLDPSTQQRIDLEAFGPSNAAVFAGLQKAGLKPLQNVQISENNRSSQ
jgi:putative photosynthetic complex assembly protein